MNRLGMRGMLRKSFGIFALCIVLQCVVVSAGYNGAPANTFCIGISAAAFDGLNMNDSAAALKAWTMALAKEKNLDVDMELLVYPEFAQLQKDFDANRLDAVNLNIEEYIALGVQPENMYLPVSDGNIFARYGVVVREDQNIETMNDFAGRNFVTSQGPHMILIKPWLQTVFAKENGGEVSHKLDDVLGNTGRVDNPSKAIFQVFFGQAHGAIVTSDAFDTACILNPQLRKELRIVYESPPLVVDLFLFNPAYRSSVRNEIESVIDTMDKTVKGRQVLTIFRCSSLVRAPIAILNSTKELLLQYQQLLTKHEMREGQS